MILLPLRVLLQRKVPTKIIFKLNSKCNKRKYRATHHQTEHLTLNTNDTAPKQGIADGPSYQHQQHKCKNIGMSLPFWIVYGATPTSKFLLKTLIISRRGRLNNCNFLFGHFLRKMLQFKNTYYCQAITTKRSWYTFFIKATIAFKSSISAGNVDVKCFKQLVRNN